MLNIMKNNVDKGYTVLYWNFANARKNVFYSKDLVNFEILVVIGTGNPQVSRGLPGPRPKKTLTLLEG